MSKAQQRAAETIESKRKCAFAKRASEVVRYTRTVRSEANESWGVPDVKLFFAIAGGRQTFVGGLIIQIGGVYVVAGGH